MTDSLAAAAPAAVDVVEPFGGPDFDRLVEAESRAPTRKPLSLTPGYVVMLEDEVNDLRQRLHEAECEVRRRATPDSRLGAMQRTLDVELGAAAARETKLKMEVARLLKLVERRLWRARTGHADAPA